MSPLSGSRCAQCARRAGDRDSIGEQLPDAHTHALCAGARIANHLSAEASDLVVGPSLGGAETYVAVMKTLRTVRRTRSMDPGIIIWVSRWLFWPQGRGPRTGRVAGSGRHTDQAGKRV